MAETTTDDNDHVEHEVEEREAALVAAQDRLLADTAAQIRARASSFGRAVAEKNPAVVSRLGQQGIDQLRESLAKEAEQAGQDLIATRDQVRWASTKPTSRDESSHVAALVALTETALSARSSAALQRLSKVMIDAGFPPEFTVMTNVDAEIIRAVNVTPVANATHELMLARKKAAEVEAARQKSALDTLWPE